MIKWRRMRWPGHVARMGEERGVYRVLVGKPEGKIPLGRPRRRWVDIRMDLQEVGCGYVDWIGLAQDRDRWRTLVSAVMNLRVLWNAVKFLTSCKSVSCSRRTLHRGVSNYIYKWNGGLAPLILNIGTGWRLTRQLHSQFVFLPKKHTAGTHREERTWWASYLEIYVKRHISCHCQESNPRSLTTQRSH